MMETYSSVQKKWNNLLCTTTYNTCYLLLANDHCALFSSHLTPKRTCIWRQNETNDLCAYVWCVYADWVSFHLDCAFFCLRFVLNVNIWEWHIHFYWNCYDWHFIIMPMFDKFELNRVIINKHYANRYLF